MDFLKKELTMDLYKFITNSIEKHMDEENGISIDDKESGNNILKYFVHMQILKQIVFLCLEKYSFLTPSEGGFIAEMKQVAESFSGGLIKLINEFEAKIKI